MDNSGNLILIFLFCFYTLFKFSVDNHCYRFSCLTREKCGRKLATCALYLGMKGTSWTFSPSVNLVLTKTKQNDMDGPHPNVVGFSGRVVHSCRGGGAQNFISLFFGHIYFRIAEYITPWHSDSVALKNSPRILCNIDRVLSTYDQITQDFFTVADLAYISPAIFQNTRPRVIKSGPVS